MLDWLRRGAVLAGRGLLNAPVSARFRVEGGSMLPALADGESALAVRPGFPPFPWNRLRRGAIVVLTPPGPPGGCYIKRIAALPGESVKLREGRLYIDDVLHPWPPPEAVPFPSAPAVPPPLPSGLDAPAPLREWWNGPEEYFVLGDNAAHSRDSRHFGPVPAAGIVGLVWLRCWPPRRWGPV